MESESHEQILSNMGSLESYLAGVPEQSATFGLVQDATGDLRIARDADGAAVWSPPGTTPQQAPVQPIPPGGVVPGSQPVYQPPAPPQRQPQTTGISREVYEAQVERAQQMEQAATQLAREKLEAEDRAFIASLEAPQADGSYLSSEQQQVLIANRYLEQLTVSNESLAQRLQEIEEQEEHETQMGAKEIVAYRKTLELGLPWTIGTRDVLMKLPTPGDMDHYLGTLASYGIGSFNRAARQQPQAIQQAQQRRQQQPGASPASRQRDQSGRFVAANGRGSNPGTPTHGANSGGLGSFLSSTPYVRGE